jgi:endonuclease-3 related protein
LNREAQPSDVYGRLYKRYGPQFWWPARTPFEVMVGAVLTQNTAWTNVEQAIGNLRRFRLLDPRRLLAAAPARLAACLRPSGYFNVKARRLRALCQRLADAGGVAKWRGLATDRLRGELLSVHGVGPETADSILLYAFGRRVFVVDAYTRRIFSRLGLTRADADYEDLRRYFENALSRSAPLYNEFHALIVRHGKETCRPRPRCDHCCLARVCAGARGSHGAGSRVGLREQTRSKR